MKKDEGKVGDRIIASSIIWSAVIISCSLILKGTPYNWDVLIILFGGFAFNMLFIWGPLTTAQIKKNKKNKIEGKE